MNNDLAIETGTYTNDRILKFLISLAVAVGMVFLLKQPQFTDSQLYLIFLLFLSVGLWITEAVPSFAVSLFIIAFLVFALGNKSLNSAPEDIAKYVTTFSSRVIWLMLAGFSLAVAKKKTQLDARDPFHFSLPRDADRKFYEHLSSRHGSAPDSICYPPLLTKSSRNSSCTGYLCGNVRPVSDIPNSTTYSTGYLEQTDFLKSGLVVAVPWPLLIIVWGACIL
jgi:di/tricarboxylate transporter